MATHHQSEQGDEMYWPTTPRSKDAELYKDYKKLLAGIAEEMQKADVIALAYMFDLPKWYSEVGATKETSYAARVLSFIEGRNIISPDSLGPLATSLEEIGRMDLKRKIDAFENRHRNRVMKKPTEETCANISDKIDEEEEDYEQFGRVDARRSYNQRRRNVVRSSSDRYPSSMWLSAPYKTTSITGTIPVTQQYTTGGSYMPNRPIIHSPPSFSSPPPQSDVDSMEVHVSMESGMHQVNDPRQKYIQPQNASRKNKHRIWGSTPKDSDKRSEWTTFKSEPFDGAPQPIPSKHLDPEARSIHLSIRTTTMTAKALKKQIEFLRERLGGSYPYLDKQLEQADNCTKETLDVLKLLARETRNQSREEEEEEDVLLYKGTTHQRNPAQRHKRYYSEGFHEGAPPVAFQRCNTQPEGTGYKISLSSDESDSDDEIQSPTGVSDELPEDIVSVEAVISPEFVSSKSRKVSVPVRSPPPPPVTSSARLRVKAESIGNINKTDGASPTHSGGAKGKQKMSVQPSKSMSSLDEASPTKESTGKKKMWPLKIFRSQKNL